MGFLSNKNINYLNINNALIDTISSQLSNVFVMIFLYQQNVSLVKIFLILGLVRIGRIIARFVAIPFMKIWGLRKTIAISIIGYAIAIMALFFSQGFDNYFYVYIFLYMIFNSIYWVAFHIFYTLKGEEKHRGKQYAVRKVLILANQAAFPVISAIIINWLGFQWYFFLTLPISVLALLLLLKCQDIEIHENDWKCSRKELFSVGVRNSLFQFIFDSACNNVWLFVLVIFLGGKLIPFGGVIALGIVVQIVWQLLIGHRMDNGKNLRIVNIGGAALLATLLGRALLPLSISIILTLETLNSIGRLHLYSVNEVVTYNDSHKSERVIWYWIITEFIRDIACMIGNLGIAGLLYMKVELQPTILITLLPFLLAWVILAKDSQKQ